MGSKVFKVRDRVVVYASIMGSAVRSKATVIGVEPEVIYVEADQPLTMKRFYAHPKQCRRLKPKKRREWWGLVNKNGGNAGSFCKTRELLHLLCYDGIPTSCEVVHVREVRNDSQSTQKEDRPL